MYGSQTSAEKKHLHTVSIPRIKTANLRGTIKVSENVFYNGWKVSINGTLYSKQFTSL